MASPGRAEAMAASEGLMAIIGAGHGAHFCAAAFGTEGFHLLGNVVGQSVLQVDPRQRRGQPPQVGRPCTDDAGKLAFCATSNCR